jgi:hypothetical protein
MSVDETMKGAVMNGTRRGEIVDEASNWLVGGGIVTMALFPLALPGIALLAVAAIPVVALAVPLLLIGGLGVGVVRLVRALARLAGRLRRPARTEGELVRIPAPHGS